MSFFKSSINLNHSSKRLRLMNYFDWSSKKDNDKIEASVSCTALCILRNALEEEFFVGKHLASALKPFRV